MVYKNKIIEVDGSTPLQTAIRTRFTIIVPFRNEAANLLLLDSISKLHYPKERFEVILVDDESEVPHCSIFNYKNRVSNSPKRCNLHGDSLCLQNGSLPLMQIV
jgi:cellulose synthase/poly-beta-1,6-N-acetylglucosamine synthase-like glycosyltransferase